MIPEKASEVERNRHFKLNASWVNRVEEAAHMINEYRLDVFPPFSLNLARFSIFPRWISSLIARLTEERERHNSLAMVLIAYQLSPFLLARS